MRAKIAPNLISFSTVKRGDWIIKVSVFKTHNVLLVAQHYYDTHRFLVKQFSKQNDAADFIELLVKEDENEY